MRASERYDLDLLRGEKRVLEMIARGDPLPDTMAALTAFLETRAPGLRCGILVLTQDGTHIGRSFGPALPDHYHRALQGLPITPPYLGACGEAAHPGIPVRMADITGNRRYSEAWRMLVLSCGLAALRSTPIFGSDGRVLGTVAMYYGEPRDPRPADPALIETATQLAALALQRDQERNELLSSKENLRLIIDGARHYAIMTLDQDGTIIGWNQGAERLTGYSAGEVTGRPANVLFSAEDRAAGLLETEIAAARSGGVGQTEGWRIRKDGTRFWGANLVIPLRQDGLRGFLKIIQDRSREHDALERLREQERQLAGDVKALRILHELGGRCARRGVPLQDCLEAIVDAAIAISGADKGTLQVVAADSATLRLVAHRGFADPFLAFFADVRPEEACCSAWALQSVERCLVPDILESPMFRETPCQQVLLQAGVHAVQSTPLVSSTGAVLGMVSTHYERPHVLPDRALRFLDLLARQAADYLERKQAEQALADAMQVASDLQQQLRRLMDSNIIGIASATVDRVTTANDYFLRLLGRSRDELDQGGIDWRAITAPEYREQSERAVEMLTTQGECPAFEKEYLRADGSRVSIVIGAVTISRQPLRWVCFVIDNTARKQAESDLRHLTEVLEERVRQAVAEREAAQANLAHVQRMEALGQLAGGIAHDFNNVLQGVLGGAEWIEHCAEDPVTVRRMAGVVAKAAERGSGVTRRLLAFARRAELQTEPVNPAALITEIGELLRHTLGGAIEVTVVTPKGLPALLADKVQLETVLINLAANARDAMQGKGRLTLAATAVDQPGPARDPVSGLKPGRFVRLSVEDTGGGIPPEMLPRVTEPFFTTKAKGKGTGLGLAMARGFAEQSGGALHIESRVGAGTTVFLWFPQADRPAGSGSGAARRPAKAGLRRARLLVVDDEALVRQVVAQQLQDAGYEVQAACSAEAALALLDAGTNIDLIVTDLSMPGMDGLGLVGEARRRRPGLPALLLTGFAAGTADGSIAAAGLRDFAMIRKPVDGRRLAERVAILLAEAAEGDDAGGLAFVGTPPARP